MTKKLALLVGVSLIAGAGLGYAASHANQGTISVYDESAWKEIRPGSPVSVMPLWGDSSKGEHGRMKEQNAVLGSHAGAPIRS